jgi:hypothetical protein
MESIDFTGLAARAVAGLHEVRACLLVSRDGLTLAALPEGGEDVARRALDRLDRVGQAERGFLVVGDEVWVISRRGPYLGIIVAAATAKAGLLLDRLESTLRAAEEARLLAGSAGQNRPDISRRPRTPLHREPRFDPTRSESRPPNVFEEMARVVSVPDKEETERSESSVGEAPATTAWPPVIREPEAPNVGGPGSGSEPPTIVRPEPRTEPRPEPEEPQIATPEPEAESPKELQAVTPEPDVEPASVAAADTDVAAREPILATPEPEESDVPAAGPTEPVLATPEPEEEPELAPPLPDLSPIEPDVVLSEPETSKPVMEAQPEPDDHVAPEPAAAAVSEDSIPEAQVPDIQSQLQALELSAVEEESAPDADEPPDVPDTPAASISQGFPPPMPRLAHPQPEGPKETPHYTPPEALLGEMGRVVADESTPADILPPGVTPVGTTGPPDGAAEKDEAPKAQEGSKERGDETEVDPVALAREFSQLFDEPERNS